MEALLKIYIDIQKELEFLFLLLDKTESNIEFARIDRTIRHLSKARDNVKAACDSMSDGFCGQDIERYRDIVYLGRWREYA